MLARIQKLIAFVLLGVLASGLAVAVSSGTWGIALVLPALIAGVYATVLACEFALVWRSYDPGDASKPRIRQLARAWIQETINAPRVFLWRQPFGSRVTGDHLPAHAAGGRRGVLLVHGFFCNRGLWNRWMSSLRASDVPFIAINLEPLFGSIDGYAEQIGAAAYRLEQATRLTPIVVAHSMGGLATRAYFAKADDRKLHRLVTIASPHAGTRLATRGTGTNIGQMRVGSEWLRALGASESPSQRQRVVCFWSHCDNIVIPSRSATLVGADNRHLVATPHVRMVDHPVILETVLSMIAADEAS